jgi:Lipase (class 3)
LGSLLLLNFPSQGILSQLASKVPPGSKIYIAGHSQGAALAVLLSSWFNYAAFSLSRNYSYKTYAFAQPKPGNDHYQTDFGKLLCNTGFGFRLTNSLDFIPQLPFTIEVPTDLNVTLPLQETAGGFPLLFTLNASQRSAVTSVEQTSMPNLQVGALARADTGSGRAELSVQDADRRLALFRQRRDANLPDRNALRPKSVQRSVMAASYDDLLHPDAAAAYDIAFCARRQACSRRRFNPSRAHPTSRQSARAGGRDGRCPPSRPG